MIVELFEKEALPESLEESISQVFQRMELPVPDIKSHGFQSKEAGFNVLLDRYASVIKVFPTLKEDEESAEDAECFSDYIQGHQYHPRSVPPIGVVDLGDFSLVLMPGVAHGSDKQFSDEEFSEVCEALWKDIYNDDFGEVNSGALGGKLMSLDTVSEIDLGSYSRFEEKGLIEPLLELHARFEELQRSFYDAWTGQKPFSEFWKEMEQAKENGLLTDGWNNSAHSMVLEGKGNIAKKANLYDEEINLTL